MAYTFYVEHSSAMPAAEVTRLVTSSVERSAVPILADDDLLRSYGAEPHLLRLAGVRSDPGDAGLLMHPNAAE